MAVATLAREEAIVTELFARDYFLSFLFSLPRLSLSENQADCVPYAIVRDHGWNIGLRYRQFATSSSDRDHRRHVRLPDRNAKLCCLAQIQRRRQWLRIARSEGRVVYTFMYA